MDIRKLKEDMDNILINYVKTNADYGFFAEYQEVHFKYKGVKLFSANENINNNFIETDYYLLSNGKIAKFKREYLYRELLEIQTPFRLKKHLIKEQRCSKLVDILTELGVGVRTKKTQKKAA